MIVAPEREALLHGVRPQSREGLREARAEFPADGEDRAQLDDDVEDLALLVVVAEQVRDDDEVAGGRYRQEFRDAFDDAQEDRVQEGSGIHGIGSAR